MSKQHPASTPHDRQIRVRLIAKGLIRPQNGAPQAPQGVRQADPRALAARRSEARVSRKL